MSDPEIGDEGARASTMSQTFAALVRSAGVLRLVVRDVDGLLQNLKTAGVPVVTAGGVPVSVGDRHVVILRDPDNFFFQLFPQPVTARQ